MERPRRRALTLEQCVYLALFALALLMHLYLLGDGALHHDETHHANYSWRLFMGLGYMHDPLLHGPFLYHINALFFFLFGDNNTTARLGPALFGSALVVMPYLIRRELGRSAALLAAVYLLISPAYLYWGRHIRHDMYAVTFELLAFISLVRYASTRRPLWLYIGAAALGLMFTTMETFFLYVAIFGALLTLVFLWRVWRPGIFVAAVLGLAIVALVARRSATPLRQITRSRGIRGRSSALDRWRRPTTTTRCVSATSPTIASASISSSWVSSLATRRSFLRWRSPSPGWLRSTR